ncbi:hypothetical protein LEP1GSC079_0274 [Leptospira interrogans str. FPW1039]|uniref:Uncharacterized protein n=2 Tax=Leptospira interrogans TaxID=173 RepID=A0A0F6ICB2_LEPIR|nr:hypothetical protein LEP1GSC067_2987 [Leptospira interrogans serovar Lora str. TE 1992]EMJ35687.1 hypothetical protein LEP1GSC079_0274 [Leptospira interrogans str. FPW1039]EMN07240.1 hypothetical protein LEP1GSC053_3602 [Leptospira interrogans serovar Muenchen str. Brem 129]
MWVRKETITFPTDAKLYHRIRQALAKEKIQLRQSYKRNSKLAFIK